PSARAGVLFLYLVEVAQVHVRPCSVASISSKASSARTVAGKQLVSPWLPRTSLVWGKQLLASSATPALLGRTGSAPLAFHTHPGGDYALIERRRDATIRP